MNSNRPVILLIFLSVCLLFLGINGVIGGVLMLGDPNGTPMGMPPNALERTPFQNYIVPGLWLIFIWGGGSLVALLGLWLRPQIAFFNGLSRLIREHWAWMLAVTMGIALLIWLTVQVFTLPEIAPIQFILYALAILLVVIPLIPSMRRYYAVEGSR